MKRFLAIVSVCALVLCSCAAPEQPQTAPAAPESSAVQESPSSSASPAESPSVPSQPQSVSEEQSAVISAAQAPVSPPPPVEPTLPEAFAPVSTESGDLRLYRYSDQVSVVVGTDAILSLMKPLAPVEQAEIGGAVEGMDELMLVLPDDTKYVYRLRENGIGVSKSKAGQDIGAPVSYAVDPQAYAALLEQLRGALENGPFYASWLSLMRQSKASELHATLPNGMDYIFPADRPAFDSVFCAINRFPVEAGTVKQMEADTKLADASITSILFENGIKYVVQWTDETMVIASTDMRYALQYKNMGMDTEWVRPLIDRINPETAKPVIYLYPQQKTDVSVQVHYKGDFTYTYPAYGANGWQVTAYPDGRLVNKADGSEHYYLFWEGNEHVDWNLDEGFVVKGADTERFLVEKLAYMGLTPREYNDFIVYWLPEMQKNPYNLISFSTEQYEQLAPLVISPKPDSVLRVHMVYKALEKPVSVKEQTLAPFIRSGFTAVEWGGSRA